MCTDPKRAKKTDELTVFFALLGSARIKSAHEMFVKSTPGRPSGFGSKGSCNVF